MNLSLYSLVIDPILRDIRLSALAISGLETGDRMLDVCCGTGEQALYYAQKGINAVGIDLAPHMIETAKRNKAKRWLNQASFQIADATSLPFKDNSFDGASISLALHEVNQTSRDRIMAEMKRVVKREGTLIFIDFQVPLPQKPSAFLAQFIEFIRGGHHFRYFKDFIQQDGLNELLRKHHLQEVERNYLKGRLITIIKAVNV